MSMFFRIFRQADKNYKIFHKYYRIEDNWNQFSNLSSQNELTQAIKTHQQEWQNFLSKLDQKKIEEIKTLSSQRFDSSPNIIQEKIGKYYYTVKHYYKKDREITQLFQIDDKGNKTLIFDPIQDKIMQQRNIQDFVLEKFHFNEDNSLLGVMIDLQNTEKPMLRIKDVQRNRMLRDKIYNCNDFFFSKNSKYIYYVKINQNQRPFSLYRHKLGNNGTLEDDLIFTEEDDRYFMESILSKSKNFYFIKLSGQQKFKILIAKRKVNEDDEPPQFISINQPGDGLLSIEHNQRGFFFLVQDDQTQKMLFCTEDNFLQQIDKIQLEDSNLKFEDRFKLQEIYKLSTKCVLSEIDFFDDNIIYYIVKKGKSLIINQNLKDNTVQEINPKKDEFGLIKPLTNNNPDEKVCQFSFDSIFSSDENFNLDLQTNKIEQTKQSQMEGKFFNIKNYKMTESFYYSYDGQKIPIILVHSQNKNVDNPKFFSKTLVISYGCYGVPTDIEFDVSLWNYLENNWILAYPLIRGSSDQGIHWHKQTLRKNKYISVQDLIYCFKYLHQSKISHSSLIAAQSNSSGAGLLFSAINNKPHLLKACILQVPFLNFLDLLSQKDLPLAGSDIEEFGDPQNLEEFKNLLQICPYHNIKEDYYPNILLSCYQQDYRTPLWHILNFAKKFRQLAKTDEDEIVQKTKNLFVRINKGSHKGVVQFQEKYKEIAEDYLFLEKSLGQYNVDLQKVEYRLKNLKEIFNQINFKYTIFQCLKQIRIQVKIKLVFLIQQLMNKSLYDDFKKKYNIRSLRKDDYKYSSQKSFLKSKTILDHENIKSTKLNQTQGEANIKENLKESQNCKDLKNICKKIKKQLKEKIEKNSVYIEEIQLQINLSKQKCLNFIEQKMKNIQLQLQKAHNLQEKEQFIFLNKISETYNQLKIMQIEEDQSKINKEQLEDIQTKIQEYNEAIYPQNDIINKESILKIFPKFENKVNNFFEQHELINLDYSKRNKTSRTGPKIKINEKYRSLSVKGNEQTFNNRESIVQRQIDKTQPLYDLPIQKNEQDPQNNKVINPKYQHSEESSDDSQSNNSNLSLQDNMQIQPSKVDFSSNQKQETFRMLTIAETKEKNLTLRFPKY